MTHKVQTLLGGYPDTYIGALKHVLIVSTLVVLHTYTQLIMYMR